MQNLANLIRFNHWHTITALELRNDDITLLKRYEKMKNELTVSENNDLILKDNRIILHIPYNRWPYNWHTRDI